MKRWLAFGALFLCAFLCSTHASADPQPLRIDREISSSRELSLEVDPDLFRAALQDVRGIQDNQPATFEIEGPGRAFFASHGVEVSEDFDENLSPALGDAQQLQQVFLNILNNAYDAVQEAGQRGSISIRTRRQGDLIEVAFTDNGTAVPGAEFVDLAFLRRMRARRVHHRRVQFDAA